MTIDKAIKILQTEYDTASVDDEPEFYCALKLGIAALKRLKEARFDQRTPYTRPLPGETYE